MTALAGKSVLVTRARAQARSLCEALTRHGAEPIVFPTIEIQPAETGPLDAAIARLDHYAWVVFTSANGVAAFWSRLDAAGTEPPRDLQVAAIGPATAAALAARGARVDFVPAEYRAERIAEGMGAVRGRRILLPRAELAREALARELRARGATVDQVAAYRTLPPAPDPAGMAAVRGGVDIATFTSASTVRNFDALMGGRAAPLLARCLVACIGPVTAAAASDLGIRVDVQATEYTVGGLVAALLAHGGRGDASA